MPQVIPWTDVRADGRCVQDSGSSPAAQSRRAAQPLTFNVDAILICSSDAGSGPFRKDSNGEEEQYEAVGDEKGGPVGLELPILSLNPG